ncbi:MAG: TRAP transporter small permease [Firmicutes bacterium]|nr:TRAP transporter small permease [Bacillota bacterium]
MLRAIQRIDAILAQIEYCITVPIFLAMLTLMCIQVVCRYFLELPLAWSEELCRYFFVASTFMGGAIATKERNHIEINFVEVLIQRFFPALNTQIKAAKVMNVFRDLVTILLLSFVCYETWALVSDQIRFEMMSPAMSIPMAIVTGSILLGCALAIVHSFFHLILNPNDIGATGYEFWTGEATGCGQTTGGDKTTCC